MDDVFYILDGNAEFLLDDRIETAVKGALIFIPKGTVRAFRVTSQTARLLNLYTHSCFERSVTIAGPSTLFRRSRE